jgi:hypothetical protein
MRGIVWQAKSAHGDNRTRAEGLTKAEVLYNACVEAAGVGMMGTAARPAA